MRHGGGNAWSARNETEAVSEVHCTDDSGEREQSTERERERREERERERERRRRRRRRRRRERKKRERREIKNQFKSGRMAQ